MDKKELKSRVMEKVEEERAAIIGISHSIFNNPELGFTEVKAAGWLTDYLAAKGFSIEQGICGLKTAFRAVYGKGKPHIAILAEYDALPEIGHACGHNIIAASAVGAAAAARAAVEEHGGSIIVIGTPAEETGGGKAIMARKGTFEDVDAAMIIHPGTCDVASVKALACHTLDVEFFGVAAHAAASPWQGINALEAMIQAFNAINSLRQHIRGSSRIHGIITDGGSAPNIVPEHSAAKFSVRAESDTILEELKGRVIDCFKGAAKASGARMEYRWSEHRFSPILTNTALAELFCANIASLGRDMKLTDPRAVFGSSDMGNVSQLVPSIHPMVAIAPPEVEVHSTRFAVAAASEKGDEAVIMAAKALAMTTVDLLADPDALAGITEEFSRQG